MSVATKRRKLATTTKNATAATKSGGGIHTFARISKATTTAKVIFDKNNLDIAITPTKEHYTIERKRKLVESEEETTPLAPAINCRDIKALPQRRSKDSQRTPENKKQVLNDQSPISINTPTKGARSLLERFFLASKTPTRSTLNDTSNSILDAHRKTPRPQASKDLPAELLDLRNLHAAFLTALSIHYAHNGTQAPADLRLLCPDVARAWGKRRVLLEDIRRTLGVLNTNIPDGNRDYKISHLTLSDYGQGKICIEVKTGAGKASRMTRPVNEDLLNDIFVAGLQKLWEQSDNEVKDFIEGLPMEPITTCPSFMKMSPLLAKGQRRLEDLKAGIMIKNGVTKEKVQEKESTNGPKLTLLERLKAKQLQQSTLPPPPSKAELDRKAALGRIEEVVAVLSILSTSSSIGQSRISFTFPTVLGKLRDSFKTPISKDEGATCVRLLASEIAPEWVRIVKMGKVEALVVNRDERLGEEDIRERVKCANA